MPPFLSQATMVTPTGQLVVARAASATANQRIYDVFDRSGRLTGRITTPTDRRIIGFGNGVVYAVRVDDVDLEWLEVYAM